MKIVVIIPTYNEKDNIEKTINALEDVFKTIKKHEMHILVVDGNSPDGTADIVRKLMQKYNNLHLIVEKKKGGLGAAYIQGMDYVFDEMEADVAFTFDADLSHDPKVLPKFIEELEKGADQVIGTRYTGGGSIPSDWGIHRKFLSIVGNKFISLLYYGSGITDFTGGYKAVRSYVYKAVRNDLDQYKGYTFSISLNLEPYRKGYKFKEIPFHFSDRTAGKSKMGAEYMFNAFIFIVKSRIEDFLKSRFGRVVIAGGIGAISQLTSYALFHYLVEVKNIFGLAETSSIFGIDIHSRFFVAQLLAIEVGIIVTFMVNNNWAFGDKKLKGFPFIVGFLKNHLVVLGAIIIQLVIAQILAAVFGIGFIRGYIYQIIGILVGLIWNFYFYKKIIWKIKK